MTHLTKRRKHVFSGADHLGSMDNTHISSYPALLKKPHAWDITVIILYDFIPHKKHDSHDRMVESCEEQALRGLCRGQCNHRQAVRPLTCRANDSDLVCHESVRCVFDVYSVYSFDEDPDLNLFWDSTTMHRGRCSTGLWKLLLEMCRTQLGPTLGVFFSYMGLYNPNGFIWKYRTLSNFMAWIITYRHFLSFYWNSHLGYTVYGCIWYNRIRITNVEFNLFAMP